MCWQPGETQETTRKRSADHEVYALTASNVAPHSLHMYNSSSTRPCGQLKPPFARLGWGLFAAVSVGFNCNPLLGVHACALAVFARAFFAPVCPQGSCFTNLGFTCFHFPFHFVLTISLFRSDLTPVDIRRNMLTEVAHVLALAGLRLLVASWGLWSCSTGDAAGPLKRDQSMRENQAFHMV